MNVNLSASSSKKDSSGGSGGGGSLGFGLNSRQGAGDGSSGGGAAKKKKRKTPGRSVLDGSSSSDDSGDERGGGRSSAARRSGRGDVNIDIAKEQEALRRRAESAYAGAAAASSGGGGAVYDYDGGYDEFSSAAQAKREEVTRAERFADGRPKESKYVSKLLRTADTRNREREVVMERRIARENAADADKEEYRGKEKFVTKAYKRKLEERERWDKDQREGDSKVGGAGDAEGRKAGEGFGMMSGSAGLLRSVTAPGGRRVDGDVDGHKQLEKPDEFHGGGKGGDRGQQEDRFGDDREHPRDDNRSPRGSTDGKHWVKNDGPKANKDDITVTVENPRDRRRRTVAEARVRYLERKRQREAGELDFRPLAVMV